ncbi:MAG: hypothetical protein ACLSGI_02345 [Butyricicoccaceae bacterium]
MKGLGKRILVMAAVTAVCVWAAGKSGYAVKPYRLDEDTLAQQVQTLKENNLTKFSGVTIYDGIVIGDTAYYVMKQDFPEQEGMLGEMAAKRSWLGTWKFYSMGYGDSGINYDVIGCGGHNFLLLSGKDPEQQVAKVTLNWYGQTYEMTNESAKPYFLLCTELTGYMPDELLPSEDMFRFTIKTARRFRAGTIHTAARWMVQVLRSHKAAFTRRNRQGAPAVGRCFLLIPRLNGLRANTVRPCGKAGDYSTQRRRNSSKDSDNS